MSGGIVSERILIEELETTKPRTREFKITVRQDAVRQGLQRAAKKVSREVRIPGFRPGKAPYPIVERYVGREYLMREFLADEIDSLIKEALNRAEIQDSIDTYLRDIEFERPSFFLEVALEPQVDLGDYMSIRIPYEEPEVTDADVDKVLTDMLRDWATHEPIEGSIEEGDLLDAVVTIKVGDEVVVDNEEVSVEVGADLYLPGLSEKLIGAKIGETLEFDLPIPEEHVWREHGEEAHVTIEIKEGQRLALPELTVELAKKLNPDVESVEELRNIVRDNLLRARKHEARRAYRQKVMEVLEEKAKVEFPPLLVETLVEDHLQSMRRYAKSLGLEWEQYLSFAGKTEEQLREDLFPDAERELRQNLILESIAKEHNIEPKEADWEEFIVNLILQGYSVEEFNHRMETDEEYRNNVFRELFRLAVLNFMSEVAQGKLEVAEAETNAEETPRPKEVEHASATREDAQTAGTEAPEETDQGTEEPTTSSPREA